MGPPAGATTLPKIVAFANPVKSMPEISAPAWAGAGCAAGTKVMPAFDADTLAVEPMALAAMTAV